MKKEWEREKMQQTDEKRYEIDNITDCDLYIATLEYKKVNLSKNIGLLSMAALVSLGHAICYDNIITLILTVIQGVRALVELTGVIEFNKEIKSLKEVKKGLEKADGYQ